MTPTVSIELDTRRLKRKTNNYPVKMMVVYKGKPERYQTVYDLTAKEYQSLAASHVSGKLQKIKEDLKLIKRKAEQAIEDLFPFEFIEFEKQYILNNPLFRQRKYLKSLFTENNPLDVKSFDYSSYFKDFPILLEDFETDTIGYTYVVYIRRLIRTKQIGTASSYQSGFKSLRNFWGNPVFQKITPEVLLRYEQWMLGNNKSKSTVGIYLRGLRKMFNEASMQKIIRKEQCYPFGVKKYVIPEPRKRKKSLLMDDLKTIYYYVPDSEMKDKAKDFWFFLYMANGMNALDLCRLRYKNISGDFITFERAKLKIQTGTVCPFPFI